LKELKEGFGSLMVSLSWYPLKRFLLEEKETEAWSNMNLFMEFGYSCKRVSMNNMRKLKENKIRN
jgi:hypothetical protein